MKEAAFAPYGGEGGERSEPDEGVVTHTFKAAARARIYLASGPVDG
jgi:hypothetical protein